jgi:hypothetical protein
MEKKPGKPPLKVVGNQDYPAREPPRRLAEPGRSLWKRVTAEYKIDDAGGVEILTLACESLDRAEALHAQIERDGPVIVTRNGVKDHPALKHELSNRAFVARSLSRLGLNFEPTRPIGRPPIGGYGITQYDDGYSEED